MPLPKTVTAQDFIDGIQMDGIDIWTENTLIIFEKLLSRARQEARDCAIREKAMNPWNDGKSWVKIHANLTTEQIKYIEFLVKEARAEGRREGLEEMDEARNLLIEYWEPKSGFAGKMMPIEKNVEIIEKLRQEYQQPT